MRQMSAMLGSHELAIVEAMISFHDANLTADEIVDVTGVPRASVYRIIPRMIEDNVLIVAGWQDRAKTYSLNMNDDDVAALVSSVSDYTLRRTRTEMQEHNMPCDPDHVEVTILWEPPEVQAEAEKAERNWTLHMR